MKEELVGSPLGIIMPSIYAKHHDRLLEAKKLKPPQYFGKKKDIQIFGKHKSGFIFPALLNIVHLSTINNQEFLAAKFTLPDEARNTAYILCDLKNTIIGLSACNSDFYLFFILYSLSSFVWT